MLQPFIVQNLNVTNILLNRKHTADIAQYKRSRSMFRREPRSSTASLLAKLLGMTRGAHNSHHFGWHMERFVDVPGMRAIEEVVDEELEDVI